MPPILHAAAAGNSNSNTDLSPHYPSSYTLDNLIAVAATDDTDAYASYSSHGVTSVDLAAPGVSIRSTTIPGNSYVSLSGTSMATPHVAGAAALIWSTELSLTAAQVKGRILSTVDPLSDLSKSTVTNGRLNLFNAVTSATPPPPPPLSDVFADDVEGGVGTWTATGLWHQSTRRADSPVTSWYYGDEATGTYDTGDRNSGALTSSGISLAGSTDAELAFSEWSAVESGTSWDRTRVQASSDGVTWTTVFESHGTGTTWVQRTVDLSAFAGGDVYLRFWFDTIDGLINTFEGWYVDDVSVRAAGSAPAPTVSSVSPSDGPAVGGTPVTITGADFAAGATVTFGGAAATNVSVDAPGTITADTPAHAAGSINVVVTNPDLQSGALPNGYGYLTPGPAPTVSDVSPSDGPAVGGTPVTITGADFAAGATVTFGGAAATTVSVDDSNTLTVETPAHAAGPVDVVVTNPDLQSDTLSSGYAYLESAPAPTVSSVSPPDGSTAGGAPVTITGADFVAGATVTFGGAAATTVSVDGSGTITADTPAHAAGPVDVVVTNPDLQSDTLPDGYAYVAPAAAPTVSSVGPPNGPTAGGTPVTITGADFVAGATVTFGGAAAATVSVDDSGTISADTPAHAAGPVDVVVTNPDLQSGTLPDGYTYLAPASASTILYFSLGSSGAVDGLSVANEDIVAFDGTDFTLHFDGSDVGLSGFRLDAFDVIGPTEILMSFTSAGSVPGISGTVDDSDLVRFTATGLGAETSGSFELYFDGSDVGLTSSGEDVDASRLLEDGRLLLSTRGSFGVSGVSGVSGRDEDLLAFTPSSLGANTAGSWSLYFDGSDVGLSSSSEDINALGLDGDGTIYLSTTGDLSVSGLSSADEDVVVFTPASLGSSTSGSFSSAVFFDGSAYGLSSNDLYAIDIPTGPANGVPVADDQGVATLEDAAVPVTLTGSDPDGDPFTYQVATDPAHGSLSGAAPDLTYVPSADFNGADSFTFTVNDGTADSDPATVTIAIAAVNDAPVADDQAVTAKESTDLEITLTATDMDGDALTFNVLSDPAHGALSGAAPDLTYTPDVGYTGGDSFTFDASDGDAGSNVATVSITVAPNSAPVADAGPDQTVSDSDGTGSESVILDGSGSFDPDGTIVSYVWKEGGTLVGTGMNPTATFGVGIHTVTLTVTDNGGATGLAATVVISVAPPNQAPVANAGPDQAGDEGSSIAFDGSGSSDPDGAIVAYAWDFGDGGSATGVAAAHVYADNGSYTVTLAVTVNQGATATNTATVTIANVAPIADAGGPYSGNVGAPITFSGAATDPGILDTHAFSWDFGDGSVASNGQTVTHTYTAAGGYTVTLTVTDNGGATDIHAATVSVSAVPVGDGIKLSKNADFSTEDLEFAFGETVYILVWSDQLDFNEIKEARWQLEGAEQPLINNLNGTYAAEVVIDDSVKQLSPGEIAESTLTIQIEDEFGNQLEIEMDVTLIGPPDTGAPGGD